MIVLHTSVKVGHRQAVIEKRLQPKAGGVFALSVQTINQV